MAYNEMCSFSGNVHKAAYQGNISIILNCFHKGVPLDTRDFALNTPLHTAAAGNQLEVIIYLLQNRVEINAINSLGCTALMQAARHGNTNIVSCLLKAGADPSLKNRFGMTALMLACVSGNVDCAMLLIHEEEIDPVLSISTCQISPIMFAVFNGHKDLVRLFLDKGVSANKKTPETDISLLMIAASQNHSSVIEVLLERGATLKTSNAAGFTAFDIAVSLNCLDVTSLLRVESTTVKKMSSNVVSKQCSDIMEAAKDGNLVSVQEFLLMDPSKAEFVTANGATPLMVAAMMGHISVARLLIQNGADLNLQDYINGWTALMQAIYHRQTEMALFLLNFGADIDICSPKGYGAVDIANDVQDVKLMKYFADFQNSRMPITLHDDSISLKSDCESSFSNGTFIQRLASRFLRSNKSCTPKECEEKTGSLCSSLPSLPPLSYESIYEGSVFYDPDENILNSSRRCLDDELEKLNVNIDLPVVHYQVPPPKLLVRVNNDAVNLIRKMRYDPVLKSIMDRKEIEFPQCTSEREETPPKDAETKDLCLNLTSGKLSEVLEKHGMKYLLNRLKEQEVHLDTFLLLTQNSLSEIGINSPKTVRKILSVIDALKKEEEENF